jgi:hypothetical protein
MKVSILSVLMVFILCGAVAAEQVYIAPFLYTDWEGKRISVEQSAEDLIMKELHRQDFNGAFEFQKTGGNSSGEIYDSSDASELCRILGIKKVIYGSVKKSAEGWYCELKLYDHASKKDVRVFVNSDTIRDFDRMTKKAADDIALCIKQKYGSSSDNGDKKFSLAFDIPFCLYWWTPLDAAWNKSVAGIFGLDVGAETRLPWKGSSIKQRELYYSVRGSLSWLYGKGRGDSYPLDINLISVKVPFFINVSLDEKSAVAVGAGPMFEFGMLSIEEKYESGRRMLYRNYPAVASMIEYSYLVSQRFKLKGCAEVDIYTVKEPYATVRFGLGGVWVAR